MKRKIPMLAYFHSPQWFLGEVPLVKISLRPCTPGCDADPARIACDYPMYGLDMIVLTMFVESGSPAYTLVKNCQRTNADQNSPLYDVVTRVVPHAVGACVRVRSPPRHNLDRRGNYRQTVAYCDACFAIRYKFPFIPSQESS